MKRFFFLTIMALVLSFATSSAFAGSQDFTLQNGSSSNICYLYISASNVGNWESDVLGADQCLAPGESINVTFDAGSQAMWDLRVEDDNGNFENYQQFNLNEISVITINGGGQASYQ